MTILLVEDNGSMIKGLKYFLESNHFNCLVSFSVKEVKGLFSQNVNIDLIILDVTLPDGNGFDLFSNFLKEKSIPTIFLTAKDDEDSVVGGLNMGAEDYLTKPFNSNELLARINKIFLRNQKNTIIEIENLKFDIDKMVCYKNGEIVNLSALETKIFLLLITNINKIVLRQTILDKIWEETGNYVDDHTVTVYLNRIRDKIGLDKIKTIKGIGYRIDYEK